MGLPQLRVIAVILLSNMLGNDFVRLGESAYRKYTGPGSLDNANKSLRDFFDRRHFLQLVRLHDPTGKLNKYGTQFLLPSCPCVDVDSPRLCDYHCCFCKLKCEMIPSSYSETLWLKHRFQECNKKEASGIPKTELIPFENQTLGQRILEAFKPTIGFCDYPERWENKLDLFFRFLCIRTDNVIDSGEFYQVVSPFQPFFAEDEAEEDDSEYTWRPPRPLLLDNKISEHTVYWNPVQPVKGGHILYNHRTTPAYTISAFEAGTPCFSPVGIHRPGSSGTFSCAIHLFAPKHPRTSWSCDDIREFMESAVEKLINIQMMDMYARKSTVVYKTLDESEEAYRSSFHPDCYCENVTNQVDLILQRSPDGVIMTTAAKLYKQAVLKSQKKFRITFTFKTLMVKVPDTCSRYCNENNSRIWCDIFCTDCVDQYCWKDLLSGGITWVIALVLMALAAGYIYVVNFAPAALRISVRFDEI